MITTRAAVLLVFVTAHALAQRSSGPPKGILVVDGGGTSRPFVEEFIRLAGGPKAKIVVIPAGASSLRFGAEKTILNPDWPRTRPEWGICEKHLRQQFGVESLEILHTRDRTIADIDAFAETLRDATGVFLGTGNAGRHAAACLGTKTQVELRALLAGGGWRRRRYG